MKYLLLTCTLLTTIACNNSTETNNNYDKKDDKSKETKALNTISNTSISFPNSFMIKAFSDELGMAQIEGNDDELVGYCQLNYEYSNFDRTFQSNTTLKVKEYEISDNDSGNYVIQFTDTPSISVNIDFEENVHNIYSLNCDLSHGDEFYNKDVMNTIASYFTKYKLDFAATDQEKPSFNTLSSLCIEKLNSSNEVINLCDDKERSGAL